MKRFLLKKIIVISFFLAISFIIEYIVSFSFGGNHCYFSLLKIELLPILLIGFLFGLKFSFFSNLFYILIHILLEFVFLSHKHALILGNDVFSLFFTLSLLLHIFIIPYLSCSITGFFYRKDLKHLNNYQNVIRSLLLITFIQIVSYLNFVLIIKFFYSNNLGSSNEFFKHFPKEFLGISGEGLSLVFFIFLFYLISVIITNIILGVIFYFLNPICKENIEVFLSE